MLNRIAVLTGVALLDDGRLDEAEAVLSAVVAAANGLEDADAHRSACLALARCQFWRGRFDSAIDSLSRIDSAGADDQLAIRVAVLRSRLAVGEGDFEQAIAQASSAVDRARTGSRPDLLALSAAAAAFAHLSVSDHTAVAADAALAVQMARRSHDPLLGLRARLIAAESHRRQGRRAPGLTLIGRIRRVKSRPLPFILRARVDLLSDLLTEEKDEKDDEIAKRHSQTTGLAGLALFAPVGHALSRHVTAITDIVSILQCCQTADEEARVLVGLCTRLRGRLQASGLAFFVEEAGLFTAIAADGVRIEPNLAPRLAALDQPIAPHVVAGRFEAGAPVRYGGRRLGVLLARWPLGTSCESKDVVVLLATAATAAGPAVAGLLARRTSSGPRTSDLIGISSSIVDVRSAIERAATAPFSVLVEGESGTRKGTRGAGASPTGSAPRASVLHAELRGAARRPCRVGALRSLARARSPVPLPSGQACLKRPIWAPCFSTRSASFRCALKRRCCARFRKASFAASAKTFRAASTCGSSLRPIAISGRKSQPAGFGSTCSIASTSFAFRCRRCATRRDDIPLLAEHFWRDATSRIGSRATLSLATLAQLARYDWPGNVRELQNVLAALAVRTPRRGVVPPSALPPSFDGVDVGAVRRVSMTRDERSTPNSFVPRWRERAASGRARPQELGVTRQGLTKLMDRLGLNEPLRPEA